MIHAKKQRWSFDIQQHTDCVDMLAIMPPPTTLMLCPMQNQQTSTHSLTRRRRRHTNISRKVPLDAQKLSEKTIVVTTLAVPTYLRRISNHVFTFHRTHGHSDLKPLELNIPTTSTSKRCGCHTVMTMVRSQLGGTHHHAPALESTLQCASTLVAPNFVATSSSRLWTKDNQPGASSHSNGGISS